MRYHSVLMAVLLGCLISSASFASGLPRHIPEHVLNVLQNHCITCHDQPLAEFGGLDLSHWVATPDGGESFVHLDRKGAQLPSKETFRVVLDRVLTEDKNLRMPLGWALPEHELGPLKAWLEERIGQ